MNTNTYKDDLLTTINLTSNGYIHLKSSTDCISNTVVIEPNTTYTAVLCGMKSFAYIGIAKQYKEIITIDAIENTSTNDVRVFITNVRKSAIRAGRYTQILNVEESRNNSSSEWSSIAGWTTVATIVGFAISRAFMCK